LGVEPSVAIRKSGWQRESIIDPSRNAPRSTPLLPPACLRPLAVGLGLLLVVLLFDASCWAAQAAGAAPAKKPAPNLPTLTTASQVHSLTSEEAKRAYPVHLKGVVTYFDTDTGSGFGAIFVDDSTGSIFVKTLGGSVKPLPIGSLVDVRGVSDPGGFAPVVDKAEIKVIGHSPLPANPPHVSRTQLFAGQFEGQWVEVEGIVHAASDSGHIVTLELAMTDGILFATSVREEGATYSSLVDAKVRIRGHEAPLYNNSGQMVGARVVFPNLSTLQVIEPAPGDPFKLPTVLVDNLLRWNQVSSMPHRVHLRGRVTMQWPGVSLCIRDATRGICAQTDQDTRVAVSDVADVVGFAGAENSTAVLTNAVFRKAGSGSPVQAESITADQAMLGKNNSELIQVDGQLIGRDLASSDATLLLTSGNFFFTAVLPKSLAGPEASTWANGSRLRITGICSVQFDAQLSVLKDGAAVPKSFRVLMRSPGDVAVLEGPSWWSPAHALVLLVLALTAALAVLAWVVALRKRLRESEQQFRHMALHDALTGLATRLLLQDRLDIALENARRHRTGLAVLMVDIDRFKEINDTRGHQAGDEVLRVTANRILQAIRRADTAARLGGDEFVVLLPDFTDPQATERIARNIVETMMNPIAFAGREIRVSVSVGICASGAGELDADTLLKNADAALYQAKANGRNRFEVFNPDGSAARTKQAV